MSNQLDLPHCPCPGGYYACPNRIHGWPPEWGPVPGSPEEKEHLRILEERENER